MKKIKILSIFLFQLAVCQFLSAQSTADENGRSMGTQPAAVQKEQPKPVASDRYFNGSDQDGASGQRAEAAASNEKSEWVFPNDLDVLTAEMNQNSAPSKEMQQKMAELEAQVKALSLAVEQLSLENRAIKKSLTNCCSGNAANADGDGAYLMQNAPNPFNQMADVNFFLPEGTQNARLEIRDMKGDVVKVVNIDKPGLGSVSLDATTLLPGQYIYSLYNGKAIIDTKVMIVTE